MNRLFTCLLGLFLQSSIVYALPLTQNIDSTGFLGPFQNGDTVVQNYSKLFTIKGGLADSADIKYFDIQSGFIHFSFANYLPCGINLKCINNGLWASSYCKTKGADSMELLAPTSQDSLNYFFGQVLPASGRAIAAGDTSWSGNNVNLSAIRMFVEWDNAHQKVTTKIDFQVAVLSQTSSCTLSNLDSVKMRMTLVHFTAIDSKGRTWSTDNSNTIVLLGHSSNTTSYQNGQKILVISGRDMLSFSGNPNDLHPDNSTCTLYNLNGKIVNTYSTIGKIIKPDMPGSKGLFICRIAHSF
jgi:hypothetical protein